MAPVQMFLSDYVFPDHWWDRQLVEDEKGQVWPLGTQTKDGEPIKAARFHPTPADLPVGLEDRKRYVRKLVLDHLAPIVRTVVDPNHGPPPLALGDGIEDAQVVEECKRETCFVPDTLCILGYDLDTCPVYKGGQEGS